MVIDIYARDPKEPAVQRTGHCVIVFVALAENGRPKPVPPGLRLPRQIAPSFSFGR
jgi:acyl-CoA hydrolase